MEALAEDLNKADLDGFLAWDSLYEEHVWVFAPMYLCVCDNPMASSLSNHLGVTATHYCRFCEVLQSSLSPLNCSPNLINIIYF